MISPLYLQPGVYIKIQDVPAPLVAPGLYYPLFVGLGRKEVDVQETLQRGITLQGMDLISSSQIVLSVLGIVDSNGISYVNGIDYILDISGSNYSVNWEVSVSITGTAKETFAISTGVNDTLKLNVAGAANVVILAAGTTQGASDIISNINKVFVSLASDDGSGRIKLTSDVSISIDGGTALSTLGFTAGTKVESNEPDANVSYVVTYKRMKLSTEYTPMVFTRLEDVFAEYGPLTLPTELITGTITTAASGVLNDSTAKFLSAGIVPGSYVKIVNGAGVGQIRVVTSVVSDIQLTISPDWNDIPTGAIYSVTDVGYYDISWACYYANQGGAQAFMACQSPDDIVDDNNFRGAITQTEQFVNGQQGYCLVVLKGVNYGDSIISFVKNYLDKVNNIEAKQERTALFGVAAGIDFNDLIQLESGTLHERIGIVVNPYAKNSTNIFGSEYIAACIAGIFTNPDYDSGEPISGKIIAAFDYIDDPYLNIEKRQIGQNGGILVQKQGTSYKIVHFLSTNTTDIIKAELKVSKQKDAIKKNLRTNLETSIINTRALNITIPRAESIVRMILDEMKRHNEINDYENLSIAFDSDINQGGDPRQLDISFLFKPTFDVNYILITFGATIS